jgi:metal-responsive CopG/Arc/MetJ family transcriptional regulator
MPLTVRLDAKTERLLNTLAKRRKQSRSDVVREALASYGAEQDVTARRPYDAWVDVIGIVSLGARDPDRTTGEQTIGIVREKARARRAR